MNERSPVLVVDDEPLIAEYLSQVLQDFGFETTVAGDFKTAVGLVHDNLEFSAAFVDLGLTDRSGLELIAELQRAQPALPVVLATAYAKMAENDQAENGPAYPILAKPYDMDAIRKVLITIGLRPGE